MGLYWNDQWGCLPHTSEDSIVLHRCHQTHRRNIRLRGGTTTGKERQDTINAMHNMMHDHDMAT